MGKKSPLKKKKAAAKADKKTSKTAALRNLDVDDFLTGDHLENVDKDVALEPKQTKKSAPVKDHRTELDALEDKDPEFYKFLKENDHELLEFDEALDEEEEEEQDDEVSDNEVSEEEEIAVPEESKKRSVLTMSKLQKALDGKRSMKGMLGILRCCVAGPDEDARFEVLDPDVRVLGVESAIVTLGRHLKKDDEALVKGTMKLVAKALGSEGTDAQRVAAAKFRSLARLVPEKWGPKLVRILVEHWAVAIEDNEDDETVEPRRKLQVECFLSMKELLPSFEEYTLRKAYSAFVRRVAQSSSNPAKAAKRAASVSFGAAGVSHLFADAPTCAYRVAFGYVRQLALKVRSALADPAKKDEVLCWRFVHATRCWASAACAAEHLEPLVFPLCQICFAACEVAQAKPELAPFKLHMVRCLHGLAASSQVYVPTTRILLPVLSSLHSGGGNKRKSTPTQAASQLQFSLLLSDDVASKEEVVKETCDSLCDWLELVRYSPACPEVCIVPVLALKKLSKESSASSLVKAACSSAVASFESAAKAASVARDSLGKSPKQLSAEFEPLRPADAPNVKERLSKRRKDRETRRNKLLVAAAAKMKSVEKEADSPAATKKGRQPQQQRIAAHAAPTAAPGDEDGDDVITELRIDDF